jgi:hypothetical protein
MNISVDKMGYFNNFRKGSIVRIGYYTELPVSAAFKKKGFKIVKYVETSARIGVKYSNIQAVKDAKSKSDENTDSEKKVSNYVPIIDNTIYYNANTHMYYLQVANLNKGHNTKVSYYVNRGDSDILDHYSSIPDDLKEVLVESYFKNKGEYNPLSNVIKRIKIDNIKFIENRFYKIDDQGNLHIMKI